MSGNHSNCLQVQGMVSFSANKDMLLDFEIGMVVSQFEI
jgi:hypothetical protein